MTEGFPNPFQEDRKESPGEQVHVLAGDLKRLIEAYGGPVLDQDSVAKIMSDLVSWWKGL